MNGLLSNIISHRKSEKMFNKTLPVLLTILLIVQLMMFFPMFSPNETFAYPVYQGNSDLVIVGPYDTAASGSANWGHNAAGYREFITIGQSYRIRQNGTISRIRLYTASTTNVTGFYLKIWRKDGSTYDLVGTSNNLVDDLVSGDFATIDLSTPITGVQEGDYYGYRLEKSDVGYTFHARQGISGAISYFVTDSTPSENDYNWEGQGGISGSLVPIELYMQAPQVVFIGDSIMAGHPNHYTFLESTATTNIASTIEKQFANLTSYTYQNMGAGSETTAQIGARFTADVVDLKPRVAVIEGGVNDVSGGSITKTTFLNNWTTMLDACDANNIVPIVLLILPWTNGTNPQMQTRDDWNASLTSLAASYTDAIVVDASSYIGQFRSGGDAGNLGY
ncbi:MAG: hypothetical protein J7M30_17370 [Deltaproteobacteria bacterium]|nr:hypothetical protein [Deltaproteobacteria bacterium]